MRTPVLALSAALLALVPVTASAQRGPLPPVPPPHVASDTWELLGEKSVGLGVDSDRIVINQNEEWFRNRAFRTLRFVAERNDVHLISLRVVYFNGHVEDFPVDKLVRQGGQLLVDLRGERSYLRHIDLRYRSNLNLTIGKGGIRLEQALLRVYGERAGRPAAPPPPPALVPPPPPPPMAGGWTEIDTRRFDRRDDRVVLSAERGDGRFGQIRIRSLGDPVEIRSVRVRYRNGETQGIRVDQRLGRGEETRPIDLDGERRVIDTVSVILEPRGRPGAGELQLLGSRREGRPDGRDEGRGPRGLIPLGEKTIGFGVDRDVIEIGRSEDWYRDRGFRALHVEAERNDVHLMSVRVVYFNGYVEDLPADRLIRAGTSYEIDLRGDRSYLRRVELTYRARPGFGGRALVRVSGEPARR